MEKNCKNCTQPFDAKRSTAEFCSTNCRVKWNNKNGGSAEDKNEEAAPKVAITDLNEKTHIVKPVTDPKPKTNYTVNTTNPQKKNSLSGILKGMGYQPATERKKFIPPILNKKAEDAKS